MLDAAKFCSASPLLCGLLAGTDGGVFRSLEALCEIEKLPTRGVYDSDPLRALIGGSCNIMLSGGIALFASSRGILSLGRDPGERLKFEESVEDVIGITAREPSITPNKVYNGNINKNKMIKTESIRHVGDSGSRKIFGLFLFRISASPKFAPQAPSPRSPHHR